MDLARLAGASAAGTAVGPSPPTRALRLTALSPLSPLDHYDLATASATRAATSDRALALVCAEGEGAAWCADAVVAELSRSLPVGLRKGSHLTSSFARAEARLSEAHEDGRVNLRSTRASACAVAATEDGLAVAHVGDVVALLVRDGRVVRRSRAHVPSDADELERVRAHGGFLADGLVNGSVPVTRALACFSLKRLIHVLSPEAEVEVWEDAARGDVVVVASAGALARLGGDDAVARLVTKAAARASPSPHHHHHAHLHERHDALTAAVLT